MGDSSGCHHLLPEITKNMHIAHQVPAKGLSIKCLERSIGNALPLHIGECKK